MHPGVCNILSQDGFITCLKSDAIMAEHSAGPKHANYGVLQQEKQEVWSKNMMVIQKCWCLSYRLTFFHF